MQQIPFDTSMLNKVISSDAAPQIFSEIAHLSASDVDRMHNNDGQAILMCAKLHIAFENYKRRFKKNPAKLSDLYKIDRDLKRIPSIQLRIEGGDFGIGYRLYFYARNINGTGFWFGRGGRR